MTDVWAPVAIAIDAFGIILSLIPVSGMLGQWREGGRSRCFIWTACFHALSMLGDALARVLAGYAGGAYGLLHAVARTVSYGFGLSALAAFGLYITASGTAGKPRGGRDLPPALSVAAGLSLLLFFLSCLPDAAGARPRAAAGLFALLPIGWLIHIAGIVLRHWALWGRRQAMPLLLCTLIPMVALALQPFIDTVNLSAISGVFSLLILFATLQGTQTRSLTQRDAELSKSGMALMRSQIQPHFLYNALIAISQLCDISPVEASEMVSKFSRYVRVNVESLNRHDPIPFADELDHVGIYLSIEQKRFEEKLRVEMDIRTVGFSIPVLSLQPIVENAVRHGVTKREEGGTVRITAADSGPCWQVTVQDDGVGFDTGAPPRDGRSHLGIENVRSRLALVCGGSLHIDSTPGKGTVATLTIPKEDHGHEHHCG